MLFVNVQVCLVLASIYLASVSGQFSCSNAYTYFVQSGLSNVSTDACYATGNTTTQYVNLCSNCQTQLKSYRTKLNSDKNCSGFISFMDTPLWYDTKTANYCGVLFSGTKISLATTGNRTTFLGLYSGFAFDAVVTYSGGAAAPVFPANSAMLKGTANVTCAGASYCYVLYLKNLYTGLYGTASGDSVVAAFGNASATCGVAAADLANTCSVGQLASAATHFGMGKFAIMFFLFSIVVQSVFNH
jgi:hypothetical protein